MNSASSKPDWDERTSATEPLLPQTDAVFESLFQRSADPIWLFELHDSLKLELVDCNQAAVELVGAKTRQQILGLGPDHFAPPMQPGGFASALKTEEIIKIVRAQKTYRFEWMMRRLDGAEVPIEVSATAVQRGGKNIHVVIARDISERKKAERELVELNQSLERRVSERTAELSTSEARFRTLVENAPEAIVVFDGISGRFLFGNQHACDLYGVGMTRLAELTPTDVSPEFQADGRPSSASAREKMDAALRGETPVFEWMHKRPDGRLVPTEVRLLRLPAEGQNLLRASIIDNSEHKRAERALRESEAKYRALFEGASQGVVLHDDNYLLEANPAAVKILGRQSASELVGKNPRELAPPFQPNGEPSELAGNRHISECLKTGSARFDWLACDPRGREIPLEVMLTRIDWSGKQLIQAFITDIRERKEAERALLNANRELQREVEQRTRAEQSLKQRVRMSTLNAELAVALNSGTALQPMLQLCADLVTSHLDAAFVRIWTLNATTQTLELQASAGCYTHLDGPHSRVKVGQYKIGHIAEQRKPLLTNSVATDPRVSDREWAKREGMVAFAGYPLSLEDRTLGVLAMFARRPLADDTLQTLGSIADSLALGIERKRAEEDLKASEARLRESEARFSAAFQASPVFISIMRMSDEKYVLANDALLSWMLTPREEVLGRTSAELDMWAVPAEREQAWHDLRTVGSIRQRECRWRNRRNELFTVLVSAERITLADQPHILSLVLDITQRKHAEVEILKALAREKELSQLKSNFVSMVSHEFRTPLGIIQSSAELLRDFYRKMDEAEREEQLESIARNTRRMASMMEEILVLSRLDAGLEYQPVALEPRAAWRRIVDEVLSATNRRCDIELNIRTVPVEARGDDRLLGHIFTNLLSNAVKYSEPGATVHFSLERDGCDAVCVVQDFGIGISEPDQQRLFSAFHRGSNVGSRPGTGLGLLLVKRCVDLHRGTVSLSSQLGRGTTVTVRLPVFEHSPIESNG
jgi:PAS domain S-box-containing protein